MAEEATGAGGGAIQIGSTVELQAWLKGKPWEVAVAIASRAALRVAPFAAYEIAPRGGKKQTALFVKLVALTTRAAAISRGIAFYPSEAVQSASDAAFAVSKANTGNYTTSRTFRAILAAKWAASSAFAASSVAPTTAVASNAAQAVEKANAAIGQRASIEFWQAISHEVQLIDAGSSVGVLVLSTLEWRSASMVASQLDEDRSRTSEGSRLGCLDALVSRRAERHCA